MDEKDIYLDEAAEQLFAQLDGLAERQQGRSAAELMSLSLAAEQKQQDVWRILLCETVRHITDYLHRLKLDADPYEEGQTFDQLSETLNKLSKMSNHTGQVLIRYRGVGDTEIPDRMDYEILFGNMIVALGLIPAMVRRHGTLLSALMSQVVDSFQIFSSCDINNFYLTLPGDTPEELNRLRLSLNLLAQFYRMPKTQDEIILRMSKKQRFSIIKDEKGIPNANLTLVAGINGIDASTMRQLVMRVNDWIQKKEAGEGCRFTSVYNAIFGLPKISGKLIPIPIEINNLDWLMRETSEADFSQEKAKVARIIAEVGGSPEKMAKVIKSVYGNDYPLLSAYHLEERLGLSSNLLQTIDNRPRSEDARNEVLINLQKRLDTVRDDVFENLYASRPPGALLHSDRTLVDAMHQQLSKMVFFFKGRSRTRKKLTAMVHAATHFEPADYEILAQDFGIDLKEAHDLVRTLGNCFDQNGRFIKTAFMDGLPHFVCYEKKIFEFLWKHLKDVISEEDRIAFLNALQVLTARMNQPKRAFKILIEDFLSNPGMLQFSDAKALMLANLILREYDKSLSEMEITPEDILFSSRMLDKEVATYAAWRMDRDQEAFFTKVRTIHMGVCEALDAGMTRRQQIPARGMLGMERELYIFLALIPSTVGQSVLRSAVNEYGSPESDIYFLRESDHFMPHLLQNLRIAIRGLANIGGVECIPVLDAVKNRESVFLRLKKTKAHQDQSRLISEWVDEAVKIIRFRA